MLRLYTRQNELQNNTQPNCKNVLYLHSVQLELLGRSLKLKNKIILKNIRILRLQIIVW